VNGEIRTYFDNHPDQQSPKVEWKAKVTVNPFFATTLKQKFSGGYFVPKLPPAASEYLHAKDGLIPFLELEEQVRSMGSAGARALVDAVKRNPTKTGE
jgi:hypothetical protein